MGRWRWELPLLALAMLMSPKLAVAADTVKIGAPLVLSGSTAEIGQSALQGLQMAVDDLNQKGGLLGRQIEIVKADDAGKPATANTVTRNMILSDKVVAIFGASNSGTGAAEETLAGQYKIPALFYGGNDISLTTTNFNRYSYQLSPSTYMEPRAVAQYLAQSHVQRVFTLTPDYNFGRSYVSNFIAGLKESGAKPVIVGQQYTPLGTTDFSSFISAALAAKPDFLFLGLFSGDLITFIRQAQGYDVFKKLHVGGPTGTDTLESMKGDTPAGMVLWARAPFFAMDQARVGPFVERYHAAYHGWPSEWPVLAYASVQVWADGVRKAGSFDGTKVADALSGAQVDTIRGTLTLRACDHQADAPVYIGAVSAKVDPSYGFPLLDHAVTVPPSKTMMPCAEAEKLHR